VYFEKLSISGAKSTIAAIDSSDVDSPAVWQRSLRVLASFVYGQQETVSSQQASPKVCLPNRAPFFW